jgi:hypothetical protein
LADALTANSLVRFTSPFAEKVPLKSVTWLDPRLTAEISYANHAGQATSRSCFLRSFATVMPSAGLDVPGAQAAGEQLDGQPLKLGGPPGQPGPDPRHERLGAIRDLRHAVLDGAFCRPQPARR